MLNINTVVLYKVYSNHDNLFSASTTQIHLIVMLEQVLIHVLLLAAVQVTSPLFCSCMSVYHCYRDSIAASEEVVVYHYAK